jgi:hypothetical protein
MRLCAQDFTYLDVMRLLTFLCGIVRDTTPIGRRDHKGEKVSVESTDRKTAASRIAGVAPKAPDEFTRASLIAAARVLGDQQNQLRLNLCCAAIRMLFEHVMGTLAPSAEVEACSWYERPADRDKPVRAQRIQYWMQGGLTDTFLKTELGIDPSALRKRLLEAFNNLSKHVHGRADTVIYDDVVVEAEADKVADAVEDLLTAYRDCRAALIDPLLGALDEGAVDSLMEETIQSVDEIATHHSIEEIYVGKTEVEAITSSVVRYRASGSIYVTLQWGSNSDLRRGDGAELNQSFPFSCLFEVPIDEPHDLSCAEIVSGVDTSSWWDGYYDEEP